MYSITSKTINNMLAATAAGAALIGCTAPASDARQRSFQTPSKNVHCLMIKNKAGERVRCEIRTVTNELPPRPASCKYDYGRAFGIARGRARRLCISDTIQRPQNPVLRFGRSWKLGAIKCTSRRSGLRCEHVRTGHGFVLRRDRQLIF